MNGLGGIIAIILVVVWVVKGLSALMGNKDEQAGNQGKTRSLEEWDQLQAQRREANSQIRADTSSPNPTQMTMAQRIELARQRARQQAGLQNRDEAQAEALQRVRAQSEQQAQQQRELIQRQNAQRERAAEQRAARERERIQQQRRQQAEQEAQLERQRRSKQQKQQGRSNPKQPVQAKVVTPRQSVVVQSMQRVHFGHGHSDPVVTKLTSGAGTARHTNAIGTLTRAELRRAFIMKEVIDKPVAMREHEDNQLL